MLVQGKVVVGDILIVLVISSDKCSPIAFRLRDGHRTCLFWLKECFARNLVDTPRKAVTVFDPARLELLPEALADYRKLGDPNVVTRALLVQINYIVDVAANMPANTHTTASGVFRLAWRGRQKSTTIVLRLRTVNMHLPQPVASCLRSPPANTPRSCQPCRQLPSLQPPAAPSPVAFVHARWKFEHPLSLPSPFVDVDWYMSRLRFGPRLMAVCATAPNQCAARACIDPKIYQREPAARSATLHHHLPARQQPTDMAEAAKSERGKLAREATCWSPRLQVGCEHIGLLGTWVPPLAVSGSVEGKQPATLSCHGSGRQQGPGVPTLAVWRSPLVPTRAGVGVFVIYLVQAPVVRRSPTCQNWFKQPERGPRTSDDSERACRWP